MEYFHLFACKTTLPSFGHTNFISLLSNWFVDFINWLHFKINKNKRASQVDQGNGDYVKPADRTLISYFNAALVNLFRNIEESNKATIIKYR